MRREVGAHHPHPARGGGRRAPRLPARRPRREGQPVPAPAVRRPLRHARRRAGRGGRSTAARSRSRPLAFMRGRTLNDSFIILDEAQNTTPRADADVPDAAGLRLAHGRDRRHHPDRPAAATSAPAWSACPTCWRASRTSPSCGWTAATSSAIVSCSGSSTPTGSAAGARGHMIEVEARGGARHGAARRAPGLDVRAAGPGARDHGADGRRPRRDGAHQRRPPREARADRRARVPGGRPRGAAAGRPTGPPPELGDVVICPEAAQEPLETLAVHGLLHLLGYDHEADDGRDARAPGPPRRRGAVTHLPEATRPPKAARGAGRRRARRPRASAASCGARDQVDPAAARARLRWSFNWAFEGIVYVLRTQRNMQIHVAAAVVALVMGLLLDFSRLELAAMWARSAWCWSPR